jgi:sugar phosphate isomerase/epimerase
MVANLIVSLHTAPNGFFKSGPPHAEDEFLRLVRKAASMGFRCFEVGPLCDFAHVDGKRLKSVLSQYGLKSSIHVGGLYDAERFAKTEEEYGRMQPEIHRGIELCREIDSQLVSLHPPLFAAKSVQDRTFVSTAKVQFLRIVEEELKFACSSKIKLALESFCYSPFIFEGLLDFAQFVSHFPSTEFGVLLEVGHLYQAKISLEKPHKRSKVASSTSTFMTPHLRQTSERPLIFQ